MALDRSAHWAETGVMGSRGRELREFLRSRRDAVRPSQVGLPVYPGRRVPGLRREEVAMLAGVSADYYTRLEQGRLTSASEGVIMSIAEALRLTEPETAYLRNLLRQPDERSHRATTTATDAAHQKVRPGILRLVERFSDEAVFVLGRRSEVLASNQLLDALLTPFNDKPPTERNLLRWLLTDPAARTLYLDWAQVTSEVVGVLRAEAARRPHDRLLTDFIAELDATSPEFRTWWAEHTVVERTTGTKRFDHPAVGRVTIDYEALTMPDDPEQVLFVYTAHSHSDEDALRILASWHQTTNAGH
jgi:transcriptional regulator with XRE-family HTH domain